MKLKTQFASSIFVSIFLASGFAEARFFSIFESPGDRPTPIPSAPKEGFTFTDGKELWKLSSMPKGKGLLGRWNLIGYADVSYEFAEMEDDYNARGIKNRDGSVMTLSYQTAINPIDQSTVLTTEYLAWGRKDLKQGPYISSIDPAVQAVVSSLFAGLPKAKTYFRFDCRESVLDLDQLVCALTLKVDPSEFGNYPRQDVYNNVLGGIAVFKRER
ncbi:MAG: hypothetical protein EOP06_31630 [Proteobacteria bacterium]|nr:MAG: hypothetical protein EOP06_31630 [Pseudomonadota bacterium]